jgi:glycosyltransferase involved in cell wall biosynthesis
VIVAESLYIVNFKKYYGIEPNIIENFPDMDLFNNTVDSTSIIKEYGLNNKIVISQIGAIDPTRGLLEVLYALKYMQNNVCLILVGRISKTIRELIEETMKKEGLNNSILILPNGVKHERTPEYYRASYATIALLHPLPAYVTSIPTKLYESLACGVPVIAANLPHIQEIVEKYKVGLCADSEDPYDIADKISILIQNPKLRETMSENCVNLVKSEMNWKHSEEKLLKLYHSMDLKNSQDRNNPRK